MVEYVNWNEYEWLTVCSTAFDLFLCKCRTVDAACYILPRQADVTLTTSSAFDITFTPPTWLHAISCYIELSSYPLGVPFNKPAHNELHHHKIDSFPFLLLANDVYKILLRQINRCFMWWFVLPSGLSANQAASPFRSALCCVSSSSCSPILLPRLVWWVSGSTHII